MRTILITGAAGTLGQRLSKAFRQQGDRVVGIDRRASGIDDVIEADLSQWSPGWVEQFAGADVVLHLAADPHPSAPWSSLQPNNIDLTLNVFEAAARANVKRVIFASTNWVMAGHRSGTSPIATDQEPFPVNGYGATKLMGERIGHFFAETRGLSVICLRIGMAERPGGTVPGPETGQGLWGQQMWLSDRDMLQGFTKAADAPADVRFTVLNLMSANEGMRWDLEATRRTIGYVPQDSHPRFLSPAIERQEWLVASTFATAIAQQALIASGEF